MENEIPPEPPVEQLDPEINLDYINQQTNKNNLLNGVPLWMLIIGGAVFLLFIIVIIIGLLSGTQKNTANKLTPTAKPVTPSLTVTPVGLAEEESVGEDLSLNPVKTRVVQEIIVGSNGKIITPTKQQELAPTAAPTIAAMILTSSAFSNGGNIPVAYSCRGDDVNPPLTITNLPAATKALAVAIDDLSANNFAHWLIWNINPATTEIKENFSSSEAVDGTNDYDEVGYKGPCPPSGEKHLYRFTVYALNSQVILDSSAKYSDFIQRISGYIINKAELKAYFSLD